MTNFYFKNHNIRHSNFSFEIISSKFGTTFIIFGATYSKFGTTFGKCGPLPKKLRPFPESLALLPSWDPYKFQK